MLWKLRALFAMQKLNEIGCGERIYLHSHTELTQHAQFAENQNFLQKLGL